MANFKNEDLKIMIEIEDLLHKKLIETNAIKNKDGYYFKENDSQYNLWLDYWNMIQRLLESREKTRERSRNFNKKNKKYHNLTNNLYFARKKNDKIRIEYYSKLLKEYKKNKKNK